MLWGSQVAVYVFQFFRVQEGRCFFGCQEAVVGFRIVFSQCINRQAVVFFVVRWQVFGCQWVVFLRGVLGAAGYVGVRGLGEGQGDILLGQGYGFMCVYILQKGLLVIWVGCGVQYVFGSFLEYFRCQDVFSRRKVVVCLVQVFQFCFWVFWLCWRGFCFYQDLVRVLCFRFWGRWVLVLYNFYLGYFMVFVVQVQLFCGFFFL